MKKILLIALAAILSLTAQAKTYAEDAMQVEQCVNDRYFPHDANPNNFQDNTDLGKMLGFSAQGELVGAIEACYDQKDWSLPARPLLNFVMKVPGCSQEANSLGLGSDVPVQSVRCIALGIGEARKWAGGKKKKK